MSNGPVSLAFSGDSGDLVACGEFYNSDNKDCYSFNGEEWVPLPPLHEVHWPSSYYTRSFFMDGLGVWVGGEDSSGGMVNELFTPEGQWVTLPLDAPYIGRYPHPCIVPLNNTHLFFSGGYDYEDIDDTWVLNLKNLKWTPLTPMQTPRYQHGCILTEAGEVLVAGGFGRSSVEIFNPVSQEWRPGVNLPSEIRYLEPRLLLWKKQILLIEDWSDLIWTLENQGWQLLDVTIGQWFFGNNDNAVLVPDSWRANCL